MPEINPSWFKLLNPKIFTFTYSLDSSLTSLGICLRPLPPYKSYGWLITSLGSLRSPFFLKYNPNFTLDVKRNSEDYLFCCLFKFGFIFFYVFMFAFQIMYYGNGRVSIQLSIVKCWRVLIGPHIASYTGYPSG